MNARGFTLLEVLIATTLMSIMMVLLLSSLRLGVVSWDRGEERIEQTSQLLVVSSFFRRHLTIALPLRGLRPRAAQSLFNEGQTGERVFSGSRDSIEYVGQLPAQMKPGLYRFRFFVAGNSERAALKLAVQSMDSSGDSEPIEDLEVIPDIEDVRFAFLGAPRRGEKPMWLEDWTEEAMPTAISIRVRVRGEEPWPAIVIAPRIEFQG